jgi:hypothetical protein
MDVYRLSLAIAALIAIPIARPIAIPKTMLFNIDPITTPAATPIAKVIPGSCCEFLIIYSSNKVARNYLIMSGFNI